MSCYNTMQAWSIKISEVSLRLEETLWQWVEHTKHEGGTENIHPPTEDPSSGKVRDISGGSCLQCDNTSCSWTLLRGSRASSESKSLIGRRPVTFHLISVEQLLHCLSTPSQNSGRERTQSERLESWPFETWICQRHLGQKRSIGLQQWSWDAVWKKSLTVSNFKSKERVTYCEIELEPSPSGSRGSSWWTQMEITHERFSSLLGVKFTKWSKDHDPNPLGLALAYPWNTGWRTAWSCLVLSTRDEGPTSTTCDSWPGPEILGSCRCRNSRAQWHHPPHLHPSEPESPQAWLTDCASEAYPSLLLAIYHPSMSLSSKSKWWPQPSSNDVSVSIVGAQVGWNRRCCWTSSTGIQLRCIWTVIHIDCI